VYLAPGADVQVLLLTDRSGWARGLELRDNLFFAPEGATARYGHRASRLDDGSYGLAPGRGPAAGVVFRGNRYEGRPGGEAAPATAPRPIAFDDWPGPRFDPRHPETFPAYLRDHRAWMLRLMGRPFGRRPGAG
jgi:hypothetical protein